MFKRAKIRSAHLEDDQKLVNLLDSHLLSDLSDIVSQYLTKPEVCDCHQVACYGVEHYVCFWPWRTARVLCSIDYAYRASFATAFMYLGELLIETDHVALLDTIEQRWPVCEWPKVPMNTPEAMRQWSCGASLLMAINQNNAFQQVFMLLHDVCESDDYMRSVGIYGVHNVNLVVDGDLKWLFHAYSFEVSGIPWSTTVRAVIAPGSPTYEPTSPLLNLTSPPRSP